MSILYRRWVFVALGLLLGGGQAQADAIRVTIDQLVFSPDIITAKVGDTIEWINKDPIDHTATVKGDWEVMIPAGQTVIQPLEKAEAVDFYCRFHPNMMGRIIVEEK